MFKPFAFSTYSGRTCYGISDGKYIIESLGRKLSYEKACKICEELNRNG